MKQLPAIMTLAAALCGVFAAEKAIDLDVVAAAPAFFAPAATVELSRARPSVFASLQRLPS